MHFFNNISQEEALEMLKRPTFQHQMLMRIEHLLTELVKVVAESPFTGKPSEQSFVDDYVKRYFPYFNEDTDDDKAPIEVMQEYMNAKR